MNESFYLTCNILSQYFCDFNTKRTLKFQIDMFIDFEKTKTKNCIIFIKLITDFT